jgi:hypothetical protein
MKIQQNYSDYFLNNPANTVTGLSGCVSVPGVSCRSLNVKLPNTIDTETQLLRGVSSDLFIPKREITETPALAEPNAPFTPLTVLSTEATRMSKSCYSEQSTFDRLKGVLPSDYDMTRSVAPQWVSPELLVGSASRMHFKYSE